MVADPQIAWLLRSLADKIPQTHGVVLASTDGLLKAAHGLQDERAQNLAALACPLFSIARETGKRFARTASVRQVVAELDGLTMMVVWAGKGSLLAHLVDESADLRQVGYELAQLVKAVDVHLATPDRSPIRSDTDHVRRV